MNSPAPFVAELNHDQIAFVAIAILAAIFFGTGIYVVSGRWGEGRPKRDAKAIARWDKARRAGFWRFALRNGSLPASFSYFYGAAFVHSWRLTRTLELSREEVIRTGGIALAVGLVGAIADWVGTRHRAEEAHDRAARLQDEQTL